MISGGSRFDIVIKSLIEKLRLLRRLAAELTALLVVLAGLVTVVASFWQSR